MEGNTSFTLRKYKELVRDKEYWLNYNPISDHEAKTKKYRLDKVTKEINTLIKEYPNYAKEYYLI